MNEFIKDCFELEKKKELAKQIAIRCLEINSIGDKRQSEIEKGKPCVFFSLIGHVGTIAIDVFKNGWEQNYSPDMTIRLDKYSALAKFEDYLAILDVLFMDQTIEEEGKELCVEHDQAAGA